MTTSNNNCCITAPAKINLYLHVTGKRADGYHLLDSIVVFSNDIADKLTFSSGDDYSLSVSGPFADVVRQDNLVTRAVRLMEETTGKKFSGHIQLEKNIPAGAGLGGGSSDAAATIKGLEKLWGPLDKTQRDAMLLKLGADVPICYQAKSCRFSGIGDVVESIPSLPPLHMVLLCPNSHSSTKDVFTKRTGGFSDKVQIPEVFLDFLGFLRTMQNDLQEAAQALTPSIKQAYEFLQNQPSCRLARMSGSGSCVFGLFENDEESAKIAVKCKELYPAWFVRSCQI